MIITFISAILILLGVVFFFGAALGIVRFEVEAQLEDNAAARRSPSPY